MRQPAVSVVIPTYGHRDFVLETLDSVWAQTFTDYEVIVINDGSPDDTAALLRPLADAGRIRYLEQANAGQAAARNRGIAEARGEFLALLDDDDRWPPDKLEWQVRALRAHPEAALVYGSVLPVDGSGQPHRTLARGESAPWPWTGPEGDVRRAFAERNWILSPGQCLLRRGALTGEPLFDPTLWGCDDWDAWLRLAEKGRFLFRERVALHYRIHAGNASRNALRMHRNVLALYGKHIERHCDDPDLRRCFEQARDRYCAALPGHWLREAYLALRRRDLPLFGNRLLSVLRLGPRLLTHRRLRRLFRA